MINEKIEYIDIDKINRNTEQPRKEDSIDINQLKNLVQSIKATGILQPVTIDEKNKIIMGELRWRASQLAGIDKIPCIRKINLTKFEKQISSFQENLHRQKMDLRDYTDEIKILYKDFLKTYEAKNVDDQGQSAFAEVIGIDRKTIAQIMHLDDKLCIEAKKLKESRELPMTTIKDLSKVSKELQKTIIDEAKITGKKVDRDVVRAKVHKIKASEWTKKGKTPIGWYKRITQRVKQISEWLDRDLIDFLTKEQNKELKLLISEKIIPFYNKLQEGK